MAMNTDTATLAKEAAAFESISAELQAVSRQVDVTANTLAGQWHGQAGQAAQAAIARYNEAAANQQSALREISANIQTSGLQYASTDEDQTSTLASSMNL